MTVMGLDALDISTDTVMLLSVILTFVVGIGSAIISFYNANKARKSNRTSEIEERLARSDKDNQLLYFWNRQLVDHIYRQLPPPPPDPPAGLFS